MVAALLVVLAATGRYIFSGRICPFASILSKQSALFPALMIVITAMLFGSLAQEYYANRRKLIPGLVVFRVVVWSSVSFPDPPSTVTGIQYRGIVGENGVAGPGASAAGV